jgi:hypothetical protein
MARRAFIGANRRTDAIRRKVGRAEVAQGARSRSTGLSVQDNSFTPIRVDIAISNPGPGGIGPQNTDVLEEIKPLPIDDNGPVPKPQTVNGFPVDIKANRPEEGDTKGDEIISDVDLKEIEKEKDLILFPPPPPPPGPFIEDLPDFKPVKTGLGVIGSGGVREQEILGGPVKRKKKRKIIPIKRKPIKEDIRKVKSKRGNARNNIKAGLTKKIPAGETIIEVINEQIEVTRKTRKVSRPAPVRSVIQLVRPRPSVPVREVRPTTRIAGQPIRRPAPPALGVPSAPVRTSRPQVASSPVRTRTSRPQVASAPVRTRTTRRQGGGRY